MPLASHDSIDKGVHMLQEIKGLAYAGLLVAAGGVRAKQKSPIF